MTTLPDALSTHIFKGLDNTHLRKTSLLESILSFYTNINVFISYCKKQSESHKGHSITADGAQLFTFWVYVLLIQAEANISLLNRGYLNDFFSRKKGPQSVINIEFFHTAWGMAENHVEARVIDFSIKEKLYEKFSNMACKLGLDRYLQLDNVNESLYSAVKHNEVMAILNSLDSNQLVSRYNDDYIWVLKAFKKLKAE